MSLHCREMKQGYQSSPVNRQVKLMIVIKTVVFTDIFMLQHLPIKQLPQTLTQQSRLLFT